MSPNGTLLAYSKPVDIKELRDQAALISIAWKEHCQGRKPPPVPDHRKDSARTEESAPSSESQSLEPALKTLTIESQDCNILVRLLQPQLLLVLVGRIPPSRKQTFRISPEAYGESRYPAFDASASRPATSSSQLTQGDGAADNASTMSQRDKDIRLGVLHVQRKRLDALSSYVTKDFEATNFVMPADSDLQ